MNKKGMAFLSVSALILIVSIYMQLYIINNDVRSYVEQSSSQYGGEGVSRIYREIPIVVNKKSAIYISYDSTIVGDSNALKIVGEDDSIFLNESGKEISFYKKKVVLDEGNYKLRVDMDNVEELNHSFKIIYRREDVDIKNTSVESI